eukprot:13165-Heterococcus_DN1.PRE.3
MGPCLIRNSHQKDDRHGSHLTEVSCSSAPDPQTICLPEPCSAQQATAHAPVWRRAWLLQKTTTHLR